MLDKWVKVCHTMGMKQTNTMTYETLTLPTELASLFINGDWSIVEYIDDDLYEEAINMFLQQCEYDGTEIVDIIDDGSGEFTKYHDMHEFGILPCVCSQYIIK